MNLQVGGFSIFAYFVAWASLRRPKEFGALGVREARLRERLRRAVVARLKERT